MPDEKVPDTGEFVPASELHKHIGEWIHDVDIPGTLVRMMFASEVDVKGTVTIVTDTSAGFVSLTLHADRQVELATADQVDDAQAHLARTRYVNGLRALADVIAKTGVQVDLNHRFDLSSAVLDKEGLEAIAAKLGVKPEHSYHRTFEVRWVAPGGGLSAIWQARYPACGFRFPAKGDLPEEGCKLYDGHLAADGKDGMPHARMYRAPGSAAVKPS